MQTNKTNAFYLFTQVLKRGLPLGIFESNFQVTIKTPYVRNSISLYFIEDRFSLQRFSKHIGYCVAYYISYCVVILGTESNCQNIILGTLYFEPLVLFQPVPVYTLLMQRSSFESHQGTALCRLLSSTRYR